MDTKLIQQIEMALTALDFTDENTQLTAMEKQKLELQQAFARAEERRTEVLAKLQYGAKPNPKAVADALLSGETAHAAAAGGWDRASLEAERDALNEGMRELRHRLEDLNSEIGSVRSLALHDARTIVRPLIEAAMEEARTAAKTLAESFAAIEAIDSATGVRPNPFSDIRKVVEGLRGAHEILPFARSIDVPADIFGALSVLRDKGPSARDARFITSVAMP